MPFSSFRMPAFLTHTGVQNAIKAALAVGAMGYLVYLVEPSEIAAALAGARYDYLAAAVALLLPNVLLEGAVWRRILGVVVSRPPWPRVYGALLCGFALGLVTPARAGDLAGRAFYFERGDRWAIAATVFVQRLMDMLAAVGCGSAALAWALSTGLLGGAAWAGLLVAGAGITLALLLLMGWPQRAAQVLDYLVPSERAREHLNFLHRLGPARMSTAAALALARFSIYATQFVFFARAFSPEAPLALLYGGTGLIFFAKHLVPPVTLMDVGIREGASVFFLSVQLGLPEATAFNAAFLLFLCNLVLPAALGAPLLLRLRLSQDGEEDADDGGAPSHNGERARRDEPSDALPARD